MARTIRHAQPLILVDTSDVLKTFAKFNTYVPGFMREGLLESMNYVGMVSVQKYMTVRKVVDPAIGKVAGRKSTAEKLGVVTSRLARSIQNKESTAGAEAIRKILFTGKDIIAEMGSKVPYAAIHEFGGRAGRNKSVTIPKRAYLNPALKDSETAIFNILKLKLELTIKAAEGVI